MTMPPKPALVTTEKALANYVADVARAFGWHRFHSWTSVHSTAGYPDETLLRGSRLVVAELKTEKGKLTPAQELWREAWETYALESAGRCAYYLWRPSDLDEIAEVLR